MTTVSLLSLDELQTQALADAEQANSLEAIEAIRLEYLGRSGQLTLAKRGLKDMAPEERKPFGQALNQLSQALGQALETKKQGLEQAAMNETLRAERIDVTMPGRKLRTAKAHPLTQITHDICRIFEGMGFQVLDDNACPEVETEHYNFEALNFPADHPARDMQDTYYTSVAPHVLLRSQTSNAQIRYMEKHQPPLRIVAPGRVYRNEEVSSRKYVLFHQIEGLLVDEHVRFSDLKGVLNTFIHQLFGGERPTRFRASYFPFTEPSAEIDVQCLFCSGDGCKVCGQSGWLEILGAGMVHPNVLENCGVDSERYNGFAFGMGVERLAMLRDAIEDIRQFYTNDLRLL